MTPAPPVRLVWLARLFGTAMAVYARLVARTSLISGEVPREQVVLAFWHEYNLVSLAVALARRPDQTHASFSTLGFRGVVITTLLERLGARVLPLPPESDRLSARALALRMAALARDGYSVVVASDGPFGPYRVAKPGALIVAREAGLPLVAWAVACRPSLRLTRRWDRHVVPLPFGRMRVFSRGPISVASRERLAVRVPHLQAALDDVNAQADRR